MKQETACTALVRVAELLDMKYIARYTDIFDGDPDEDTIETIKYRLSGYLDLWVLPELKNAIKQIEQMENTINVRGSIDALKVAEVLTIPKADRKISSVRATAASLTGDTGKTFNVTSDEDSIIVTRVS